jgi:hypothetical protein
MVLKSSDLACNACTCIQTNKLNGNNLESSDQGWDLETDQAASAVALLLARNGVKGLRRSDTH